MKFESIIILILNKSQELYFLFLIKQTFPALANRATAQWSGLF